MKKNYFKKILTFFLSGAMLTSVGCKDYDDDIDSLKKDVDGLKGDVVTLKTDVGTLKQTAEEFRKIDFSKFLQQSDVDAAIGKALEGYARKSDLEGFLNSQQVLDLIQKQGYVTGEELQKAIDKAISALDKPLTEEKVKEIFKEMIGSKEILDALAGDLQQQIAAALKQAGFMTGESSLSTSQMNAISGAIGTAITEALKGPNGTINKWLGEHFSEFMKTYMTDDAFKMLTGKTDASAIAAAILKLRDANSDFSQAILSLIDQALGKTDEGYPFVSKAELITLKTNYDTQLSALWSAVGDLAGRIQSMVFVPTTDKGTANFGSVTLGNARLTAGAKATMSFRVSPAILAESIAKGVKDGSVKLTFIPEKVEITRAAAPVFKIEGDVTAENGKITMLVTTDYQYSDPDETCAVALQVINSSKVSQPGLNEGDEDKQIETGIEYTSAYITTVSVNQDVKGQVVLAKILPGDKFEAYSTSAEYNVAYNDTKAAGITLLGDYEFAFEEADGSLITLSKAAGKYNWDVTPEAVPAIARKSWSLNGVTGLTLTPADPMVNAAAKATKANVVIKIPATGNIDKKIGETGDLFIRVGTSNIDKGTYSANVNFTRETLGNYSFERDLFWNFPSWKSGFKNNRNWDDVAYPMTYVKLEPALTNIEDFNDLAEDATPWDMKYADDYVGDRSLRVTSKKAGGEVVEGKDAQALVLTVKGYGTGYGEVVATKTLLSGSGAQIRVAVKITIDQPSDLTAAPVTQIAYNTAAQDILAGDWVKTLYNGNAGLKEKFGFSDVNALKEYINLLTFAEGTLVKKNLAVALASSTDPNIEATLTAADFTGSETPSFQTGTDTRFADSNAPFAVKVQGKVTLAEPENARFQQGMNYNLDGTTVYGYASGNNPEGNGNTFTVNNTTLTGILGSPTAAGTATPLYDVTYEILTTSQQGKGDADIDTTAPAQPILKWNTCNITTLRIAGTLSKDGAVYDVTEFEVRLRKPFDFAAIKVTPAEQKVAVNTEKVIDMYSMLSLKDAYDNVLIDKDGLTTVFNGADCYALDADWSKTKLQVTRDGKPVQVTGITWNGSKLTIPANNLEVAGEYDFQVTGMVFTGRYNPAKTDISLNFKVKGE